MSIFNILTIAGSDPSGGAGIQADLKTFSALGTFGMSVLTALTAQNTMTVTAIHAIPPAFIGAQLDTLFADVRIDAVKIGMLGNAAAAEQVVEKLKQHKVNNIVLDPVMVAKSGAKLLDDAAIEIIRTQLIPLARVVTPNLPEIAVLLNNGIPKQRIEMEKAAIALAHYGAEYIMLKGGHLAGETSEDIVYNGREFTYLSAQRINTHNTHGTGCTLSSAIAALLPQKNNVLEAIQAAKDYVTAAIQHNHLLQVGQGHGPVHHFHAWW